MQMAEGIHRHGKLTVESGEFPVHPDKLPFFLEPLNIEKIHKYVILSPFPHIHGSIVEVMIPS